MISWTCRSYDREKKFIQFLFWNSLGNCHLGDQIGLRMMILRLILQNQTVRIEGGWNWFNIFSVCWLWYSHSTVIVLVSQQSRGKWLFWNNTPGLENTSTDLEPIGRQSEVNWPSPGWVGFSKNLFCWQRWKCGGFPGLLNDCQLIREDPVPWSSSIRANI
jgi:hypothetical protein